MRSAIAAGALAGAVAAVAFLIVHAMVIMPIWWSAGAAWKAVACGAAIGGAAYIVLQRLPRLSDSFVIALFLWLALLVQSACIHLARLARVPELLEDGLGIAANVVVGAASAYAGRRTPVSALAGIVAAFAALVTAGPVSRLNVRAAMLFAGLLPVDLVFGAVLALGAGLMAHLLPRWKPQEV